MNIGLTKSPKRGHHKNVKIHNPQDWSRDSYLRDDVRIDSKEYFSEVLKDYKLCPADIDKIRAIINKKGFPLGDSRTTTGESFIMKP